jgi:hypothetical protein
MIHFAAQGGSIEMLNLLKNKKSDKDFEIEFTDPNNEFEFIYGIVVCNSNAAYFENNGSITELLVFKAFTIL